MSTMSARTARPAGAVTGPPRVLVILGHPRRESLCGALADVYAEAARGSGADVTVLRLGGTSFDLGSREPGRLRWEGRDQDLEPDVRAAIDLVGAADHLVFVFPQWWGTYPAVLKGFIDRVFLSQFAFAYRPGSRSGWDKLLTGRTARVVMTMDSPVWWDRVKYRSAAVRSLVHATLWYCGIRTVGVTRLPRVRTAGAATRAGWLRQLAAQARKDVRRVAHRS